MKAFTMKKERAQQLKKDEININPHDQLFDQAIVPQMFMLIGELEIAELNDLMQENPNPKTIGLSILHLASVEGKVEAIKTLIDQGANIEASGANGFTPLHVAVSRGQLKVMEILIDRGANIEAPCENGFTPLYTAALKEQIRYTNSYS
jgi:26S proteasome non-ATPase regulatory subunit 10